MAIFESLRVVVWCLAAEYSALVVAVAADFASGVGKARRQGVRHTSRGYRRTFDKLGRYMLALGGLTVTDAIVMAALCCARSTGVEMPGVPLVPVFTSLGALGMALTEVKSICERMDNKESLTDTAGLIERVARRVVELRGGGR